MASMDFVSENVRIDPHSCTHGCLLLMEWEDEGGESGAGGERPVARPELMMEMAVGSTDTEP